ncbi:MAG: PaaI family thioesterase [Sedimenticola sp.]
MLLRPTDWLRKLNLASPERRLEWFPPFRALGIRVLELEEKGRRTRIRLPLSERTRNPGGSMFGGAMASVADAVPALACAKIFTEYTVWTRSLHLEFLREGRTDLELRFEMEDRQLAEISAELEQKGRSDPLFRYGFYLGDGLLCARVESRVAIRATDQPG